MQPHNKFEIQRMVYKGRVNVALEVAERTKVYKEFHQDLQQGLVAQIKSVATEDEVARLSLLFKAKKNIPLEVEVKKLLSGLSIAKAVDILKFLIWGGERGGQASLDKFGISAVFNLTNTELVNFFENHANLLIQNIDNYSAKWIARTLQRGAEQGWGPRMIADNLLDDGLVLSRIRADRIAITELAYGMTHVELESYKQMGIKEKVWRTSKDELVCPICLPLDGTTISLSNPFSATRETKSGSKVTLVEGPPAHPSCRCFVEQVIPEEWELPPVIWTGA